MNHRRESLLRARELARRVREFGRGSYGLQIDWFVYDDDASEAAADDVYATSNRVYGPPRRVSALWLVVADPSDAMREEGRYVRKMMNGALTLNAMKAAGIPNPTDVESRINDVVRYQGEYYNVVTFDPRGHLGQGPGEQTFPFTAFRLLDSDMPGLTFPDDVASPPWQ